ncbi:hypothetical protein ACTA71_009564 [Dictyostelium dimigraforme]
MYTYSQSIDTMYVLFQTNKHPSQNGSIAVFPRAQPTNVEFAFNIKGLDINSTIMIFTNPKGQLYATTSVNDGTVEICEINLEKAICERVVLVSVGYNPAFLNNDGSKLILVGNIESSYTPFFVLDTLNWSKSTFTLPYTWNDETLNTFTFFNYF